mgnify:FL=1
MSWRIPPSDVGADAASASHPVLRWVLDGSVRVTLSDKAMGPGDRRMLQGRLPRVALTRDPRFDLGVIGMNGFFTC